jgi:hypothetical protein
LKDKIKVMDEIKQPWLMGIVESLTAANLIRQSKLEYKNRFIVILLDSALEIAFRDFLKRVKKIKLVDAHKHRDNLISAVKKNTSFDSEVWDLIDHYYEEIRCDFYHSSSDKTLSDKSLETYIELVEFVIDSLFKIKSRDYLRTPDEVMLTAGKKETEADAIYLGDLKTDLEIFLFSINKYNPESLTELNEHLRREGARKKFTWKQFSNCVSTHYHHLFFYDKSTKRWSLSVEGLRRLKQIKEERSKQNGGKK